jgi:hypothetical protein
MRFSLKIKTPASGKNCDTVAGGETEMIPAHAVAALLEASAEALRQGHRFKEIRLAGEVVGSFELEE